jgi:hypothetical protein
MRWAGHVACMGCELYSFRILVVKTTGQKPLGGNRIGLRIRVSGLFSHPSSLIFCVLRRIYFLIICKSVTFAGKCARYTNFVNFIPLLRITVKDWRQVIRLHCYIKRVDRIKWTTCFVCFILNIFRCSLQEYERNLLFCTVILIPCVCLKEMRGKKCHPWLCKG